MFAIALGLMLAADPSVKLTMQLSQDSQAFEIIGLGEGELDALRKSPPADWATIFSVSVKQESPESLTLPMSGRHIITSRTLRFEPRFPPAPGVTYRVSFSGSKLPIVGEVTVPKVDPTPRTSVVAIFPSANRLPENTLRFYLQFSGPMNLKDIYRHVKLIRDDGQEVDHPFLEIEEQLWSADGTRLTLLCDPGRVKRGLVPREQDGSILEEGRRYTLVIDRGWEDAEGRLLRETARKTFDVGPPDDTPVDPANWTLQSPVKGWTNPLLIRLAEPLDRALLARMVWIEDAGGHRVPGELSVGGGERVLTFAPAKSWTAGCYHLTVDTRLEDLCGNRVGEAFEVDMFQQVQQKILTRTVRRAFEVR